MLELNPDLDMYTFFEKYSKANHKYLNSYDPKEESKHILGRVIIVDLEYLKKLQKLQNDYPLAQDKIVIKREMLYEDQLKIDKLYNIPIVNNKTISA